MTRKTMSATAIITFLSCCGALAQETAPASATFLDAKGKQSGTAELTPAPAGGVIIRMEVSGLPANQWVPFMSRNRRVRRIETARIGRWPFQPSKAPHGFQQPAARMPATCQTSMSGRMVSCAPRFTTR